MIRQVKVYNDYPENGGKLKKTITSETLIKEFGKNYEAGKNFTKNNPATERKAPDFTGIKEEQ